MDDKAEYQIKDLWEDPKARGIAREAEHLLGPAAPDDDSPRDDDDSSDVQI